MKRLTMLVLFACVSYSGAGVNNLRCEYQQNPLGIDITAPRLSWQLDSTARGEVQQSAQILVASSLANLNANNGDLWNTTINSSQSFQVPYAGTALQSEMACYWKVRVTGLLGSYGWSQPALWSMGLLSAADWSGALWIGDDAPSVTTPSAMLRKSFTLSKPIRRAMVYATSQGTYELRINGQLVGDQILAPGWTDYRTRILYQTFDVTDMLNPSGGNAIGAIIGDGWYNARMQGWPSRAANGSNGRTLRLKLAIDHTDGSRTIVVSDGTWKLWQDGYIRMTDIYNGETQDLRKLYLPSGGLSTETIDNTDAHITFTANWTNINSGLDPGIWYLGTARSCNTANDYFQYTNSNCTRLRYYATRASDEGRGQVYIDNVLMQTFDLYNATRTVSTLIYDSGVLPQGSHTIRVVVLRQKAAAATDYWVECDKLEVTAYQAAFDMRDWDRTGFNDITWTAPKTYTVTGPVIVAQNCEPIRVEMEKTPLQITQPTTGVYIFDMGQNMVGWCRLKVKAAAGTAVTLRHGEMLNTDGTLYTANLRSAAQTDVFTMNGADSVFEPHFTYHGFRYVEVTGLTATPAIDCITGRVFHSDMPLTGSFSCSDTLLNRIFGNTLWGQRGNHTSVPTDCPQRDERMGWMGDAQIFSQTAIFNMGMGAFYTKWLQDMRDDQTAAGAFQEVSPQFTLGIGAPAWGDAGVIIPWRLYLNYGDIRLISAHYAAVKKWVDLINTSNTSHLWLNNRGNDFGDWLDGSAINVAGYPTGGAVPKEVFATAFFYNSALLCAKMATLLGNTADATTYTTLANNIKAAFNAAYVNASTGAINGGSQAGYALALNFDMLADSLRPRAAQLMNNVIVNTYTTRISTGFNTTLRLMMELTRWGYNATAYSLAQSRRMPSWGYSIDQGATTIWERWDGWVAGRGFQDAGMNSFNHYSFGSVTEWFYRVILGINWDEAQPGYKHFFVKPQPGGTVTWADGAYGSLSGRIVSSWHIETDSTFTESVTVPGNSTADISIPKRNYSSSWAVQERMGICWRSNAYVSGVPGLTAGQDDGQFITFKAGSGDYVFHAGRIDLVSTVPPAAGPMIMPIGVDALRGAVRIKYAVAGQKGMSARVVIRIFDMHGRCIAEPVNAVQKAGTYSVAWKTFANAAGLYLCSFRIGDQQQIVKRCMVMKRK